MGYFVMVFVLLIAAAGLGYVAGHPPGRTAPTTAVTAKPANPPPPGCAQGHTGKSGNRRANPQSAIMAGRLPRKSPYPVEYAGRTPRYISATGTKLTT